MAHLSVSPRGKRVQTIPPQPNNPESQNFENMKKASGDVIILTLCNKKHNKMMYAYSDMECNRQEMKQKEM